jgi:EpsI family protein
MEKLTKKYLISTLVILITALVVNFLSYGKFYKADAAIQSVKKIPLNMGKWQGRDVPLDSRVYDILETRAILNRNYVENGHSVFLSLVYYPETKVDFHAPEGCLSGRGIEVSKSPRTIYINYQGRKVKINLNQLVRRHAGSDELIYYFYKAGDFVGQSYIKLRLNLAMNKFGRGKKSGSLIRVSTPVFREDYKSVSIILTGFIEDLYPHLNKYL